MITRMQDGGDSSHPQDQDPERQAPGRRPKSNGAARKPSVRRIAAELGVSVATVSRVLNNHPDVSETMRRRVISAARDSGYVPTVGKKPENVVALLYPREQATPHFGGFESQIISGILSAATDRGFDVAVLSAARDKHPVESYSQFLRRKGARGVIVREKSDQLADERIAEEGFPSIIIAERSDNPRVNYVDAESRTTSRQAVEHLIGLGHRRIAVATEMVLNSDHSDRVNGYREALLSHGIEPNPAYLAQGASDQRGGVQLLHKLLALPDPPTAIYFTTPLATVGALHRCAELGIRVPRDLSIVGFDEEQTRLCTFPRFTAVCQDARGLAVEAANWLISYLRGSGPASYRVHHETAFSIHESTGPAPETPVQITDGHAVIYGEA